MVKMQGDTFSIVKTIYQSTAFFSMNSDLITGNTLDGIVVKHMRASDDASPDILVLEKQNIMLYKAFINSCISFVEHEHILALIREIIATDPLLSLSNI
jgi:hypothetical protein